MLTLTEQQLIPDVTKACAGDIASFERLIHRCRHTVTGIALAIVKDLDASEEVAQQVFIHVWQHLNTLREPGSFLPWVRQITRYRAYNYLRDHRVGQHIVGEQAELLLAQFVDPTAEVADNLQRAQQNLLIQHLIDALPDESREIVLLYYREEQSSQQVAELLGLSDANVRKKLSRVRELIKDQLLHRYGGLLCSTAPSLGFSSLVAALLISSSPPAAASVSVAVSSNASSSTVLSKLMGVVSGAFIGAIAGIAGAYLGMNAVLKRTTDASERTALKRVRHLTIVWICFSAVLLMLSYEWTPSAWGPITAYLLFILGLVFSIVQVNRIIAPRLAAEAQQNPAAAARHARNTFVGWLGCICGVAAATTSFVYAMHLAGRL